MTRVALTGTPGTGKKTVAAVLAAHGHRVIDVNAWAAEVGALGAWDEARQTREVDVGVLARHMPTADAVLFGHLAHLLPVDFVIVLRCAPETLRRRLEARGWPPAKVQENVEAEAVDVITVEATEEHRTVFELDTTAKTPEETAAEVERILAGDRDRFRVGRIDWSEEVLRWY